MARKRQKKNLAKQVLAIGGFLALIQVGLIFYFSQTTGPKDIKDVINSEVEKTSGLDDARKARLRVQLAVNHYRTETGEIPPGLDKMVPKYFDSVPLDPVTKKPFAYRVEGSRFFVGEAGTKNKVDDKSKLPDAEKIKEAEQAALIASLDKKAETTAYVYDPTGKVDPFRPFDASPKVEKRGEGLASYDIGQLRLTAVVGDVVNVEDSLGKGFIARKGTKIGLNGGEIVEINPDNIKILETSVDFTGKETHKVIEMKLRSTGEKSSS